MIKMTDEIREKPLDSDIVLEFDDGVAKGYLKKEYERRYPKQVFWTMGDGSTINIRNMTDNHLLNAIKLIDRKRQERDEWIISHCFEEF